MSFFFIPQLITISLSYFIPRLSHIGGAVPMIVQSAVVSLMFFLTAIIFLLKAATTGRRVVNRIYREHMVFIMLFMTLTALAVLAAINGFDQDVGSRYLLGDTYKFIIPFLGIFFFYSTLTDARQYEKVLYAFYWIAFCMQNLMLIPYLTGKLDTNERLSSIYSYPILLVIGYYFIRRNRLVRPSMVILLLTLPLYIYYMQSLTLLMYICVIPALAAVLYRYRGRQLGMILAVIIFASLAIVYVVLFRSDYIGDLLPGRSGQFYLSKKFAYLAKSNTMEEKFESLGGGRMAEPRGVIEEISSGGALKLLFGAGMGSTFTTTSVTPTQKAWTGIDHFVHAGITEALLRTGVIGGMVYLLISIQFIRITMQYRQQSLLVALCAAKCITDFVFMIATTWLGNEFLLFFLLAFTFNKVKEQRSQAVGGELPRLPVLAR